MDNAYRMWYYYYDGGIRGLYKTTHTLSLYTDYNIGGVWDQSNSKVYYWHDGVNTDNDATTNGTITHNSSRPFLFMQRHADWAGSTGSNYDFMFFALFNVVLTDEQMHLLAERPYGMLEETVAPVYHWGVAAAAEQTMPIISDAGVHNAIYHGLVISG
ncbi:MAG: hypothetical protein GWN00_04020 [Aliifodinibius sp.]|nr:hypothetical protein [Fodinibius sp.]NIW98556.1 hypothetical protein [Phycisphaerae bacterium]NIY24001.1 hypothetical protein [Fodinibius sp.]